MKSDSGELAGWMDATEGSREAVGLHTCRSILVLLDRQQQVNTFLSQVFSGDSKVTAKRCKVGGASFAAMYCLLGPEDATCPAGGALLCPGSNSSQPSHQDVMLAANVSANLRYVEGRRL